MSGTITYNYSPEQTVYAIVECDTFPGIRNSSSGALISNAFIGNRATIQRFPADGNIIVREGVVKEIQTSVRAKRGNADARLQVRVVGGVVVSTGDVAQLTVDVVAGVVTSAALLTTSSTGSDYLDGTGFTFLLATTAGGGDGLAEITYDVVNGQITNLSVSNGGTTYTDGTAVVVTDVPIPTGTSTPFAGRGYFPDSTKATFTCDIAGGVVIDTDILTPGAQYADGTGFTFNLVASFGGGDGLAVITYDVVDGMVCNAFVSAGGTGYTDGINNVVTASDVTEPVNQLALATTAGGGNGAARIGYTIVNGSITNTHVVAGGAGYTDGDLINVTETLEANENEHELIYRIRFNDDQQTLSLEAPVDSFGVEQTSDIFATLTAAVTEYETRLSS